MHLNDSSYISLHLKTYSIPKSKFRKILLENTTIIVLEIIKLRLQILEALHIKAKNKKKKKSKKQKTKNLELIEIILKIAAIFWNAFHRFFFFNTLFS